MPYICFDNAEIHYQDEGTGEPAVVLLHGGALDLRMWDEVATQLGTDHRVIRFDARGHGRSSTPTTPFRQCDDVAAVLRSLRIPAATLVGLSMGAGAATDTALEYPELVSGLAVSGAGTNEPTFTDPWMLERQLELEQAQQALDAPRWIEAFLTMSVVGPHRTAIDVDPSVLQRCREMVTDTVAHHVRPDAVPPHHVVGSWERLTDLAIPATAIVGSLDSDDHLAMVQRFARAVPGCTRATVDGSGHLPAMERPAEFVAIIRDLLARH